MKAVLLSIQPKWCGLIASGKKTVEIRKTKPAIETPFKCYIYCTKSNEKLWILNKKIFPRLKGDIAQILNAKDVGGASKANGKVIGEFVCKNIDGWGLEDLAVKEDAEIALSGSGLTRKDVLTYLGISKKSPRNPNKYYALFMVGTYPI